jgi:hypothetical protein
MRRISPLVLAAVLAVIGLAPPARADFLLRVSGTTFTFYNSTNQGQTWFTGTSGGTLVGSSVSADNLSITATVFLSGPNSTLHLTVGGQQQASQHYLLIVQESVTNVPTAPPLQILAWNFAGSPNLAGLTETGRGWISSTSSAFASSNIIGDTGTLTAGASGSTSFSGSTGNYSWTEQYVPSGFGAAGNSRP